MESRVNSRKNNAPFSTACTIIFVSASNLTAQAEARWTPSGKKNWSLLSTRGASEAVLTSEGPKYDLDPVTEEQIAACSEYGDLEKLIHEGYCTTVLNWIG